MQSVL